MMDGAYGGTFTSLSNLGDDLKDSKDSAKTYTTAAERIDLLVSSDDLHRVNNSARGHMRIFNFDSKRAVVNRRGCNHAAWLLELSTDAITSFFEDQLRIVNYRMAFVETGVGNLLRTNQEEYS